MVDVVILEQSICQTSRLCFLEVTAFFLGTHGRNSMICMVVTVDSHYCLPPQWDLLHNTGGGYYASTCVVSFFYLLFFHGHVFDADLVFGFSVFRRIYTAPLEPRKAANRNYAVEKYVNG